MAGKRKKVFRGDRLQDVLTARGMTQEELAARIGSGTSQINRYISGKQEPTPDIIKRIAEELRVPAGWLMGITHEELTAFIPDGFTPDEINLVDNYRANDMEGAMRRLVEGRKPPTSDKPAGAKAQ